MKRHLNILGLLLGLLLVAMVSHAAIADWRIAPNRGLVEQPRDALGRFASKTGGEAAPGSLAEKAAWDAIEAKPGWQVTRGRVYATDATGQIRVCDGYATTPGGRIVGLEVKGGTGRFTAAQRAFDTRLNVDRLNEAGGIGRHEGLIIRRAVEVRPR